ncbi:MULTISPECIES: caspase family protein [unclassified Burkholderia]|uniref:caspase family protein n=1 Tax=unclassified Burkholderia TaxID=2613784 RepID=UPI00163976F5|nr:MULTISPECIES: caspase family protein [unclassified Burkholderia]
MNRKALIIASPGKKGTDGYLPGVERDMKRYKEFLKSPLGGAWRDDEIAVLENPSKAIVDVNIILQSMADYSFTVFCGHGRHIGNPGSTYVQINDVTEIDSNLLRKGAEKHTLILDCCRVVYPTIVMDSVMAKRAAEGPTLNPQECRRFFDQRISECASGIVVMHACSLNETAGETSNEGGYFSSAIVKCSRSWHQNSDTDTEKQYSILSASRAFDLADTDVKARSGGRQNPTIEKPRVEKQFPFAVIA